MYFGDEGPGRLQVLVDELVSKAVDQFLRGSCTRVDVNLRGDGWIEVSDDGAGLPFDVAGPIAGESLAEHCLVDAHFTATADGGVPHVHLHTRSGIGIAVINAACESLVCRSFRNGNCWEQSFMHGWPVAPPRAIARRDGRGTRLQLRPDPLIFGASPVDTGLLRSSLWRAAHLFSGLVVGCGREMFFAPNGLSDLLHVMYEPTAQQQHAWRSRSAFRWHGRYGNYAIDAAAIGFAQIPGERCRWQSWVNGRSTPLHGTHVDGFSQVLRAAGWEPASAMLHIIAHDPRYAGPTRDRLAVGEVCDVIRAALGDAVRGYCVEHAVRASET